MAASNKVILAYSGGLDTSVCIHWLKTRSYQVVAFCADLGQGENLSQVRRRAFDCGAQEVVVRDLKNAFAESYILPALKAGAVYEGKYLLATALSRPLIAHSLAEFARTKGCTAVAHGCTGKGNDQVRLEVSLRILSPNLKILAPVREWSLKSRQEEIAYAKSHRLPTAPRTESRFSIDQNLWGVSIESGPLEDPWVEPPSQAFRWTKDPALAPSKPRTITIAFRGGVPAALDGKALRLVPLIQQLNRLGAEHGVGRTDLIEDRLVGIKSREVYEAPAGQILHAAHRELEQLTLDRETLVFKEMVSQRYARLIYDGLWFTPLKQALDRFVEETQAQVTGSVRVKLFKGSATVVGRRSAYSRYRKSLATYEGKDDFHPQAASGFIRLWGLPYVGGSVSRKRRRP